MLAIRSTLLPRDLVTPTVTTISSMTLNNDTDGAL
jgi:hypothetical protein